MEHEIVVNSVGGATTISSKALNFYNIEHSGGLTHENIKATILRQLVIPADDPRANFTMKVIDQRPEKEENYNEKRKKESLEHKPKHARI